MTWFRLREALRAFLSNARGGTAVVFALGAPALALLVCGAIDVAGVNADHSAMQDTADATSLAMAKQLGVATAAGISARAQDYANGELGKIATADGVAIATTISPDNTSVTVTVDGSRPSFFGNLIPPGGWKLHAQATASTLGVLPLCVLSSGTSGASNIQLTGSPVMTAGKCLVQSNQNISADTGASLTAGLAQATGTATGPISPSPQTGAPTIADPFASVPINPPLLGLCSPLDLLDGITTLVPAGLTHCANINIKSGQTLQLLPGVHYFASGTLTMQNNATLTGSGVVLIFANDASFVFKDNSNISLSGMQTGPFAGFVIATTRGNTNTFTISSDSAHKLEGAVYVPDATLLVTGNGNKVADQSAWTVIVAKGLKLQGSPTLVVNADYASSSVPVPAGAGNKYHSGQVTLSK